MLETMTTTMRVTFAGIADGHTRSLLLHKMLTRPDGGQKRVSLIVPIREDSLLARANKELQLGDEIEVVIETRWAEESIPKSLLDFSKVYAPQEQKLSVSR